MRKRKIALLSAILATAVMLGGCGTSSGVWSTSSGSPAEASADETLLPWDYRLVESTVGDLIGSDMAILPDNKLLPNDNNYATNDKVWTLQYMEAKMTVNAEGRNAVTLTEWMPIKSFKTEKEGKQDFELLKVQLTTEVDLVGVYKTTYKDESRYFAVLSLPTGNQIKQPIDEKRYTSMKSMKQVNVLLEEVHDYENYDLAYAKFRGWAS
ncbi:hypothetical protein [Paenibacillus radicis (ex Gao et al. 2016)]|uniref:Uncharacterized protein n=1 Tax=Paenibacillus radicis (ex Gao et al. 2016) TaxID=1737354 RepID=A0A917M1L6_9BACL|nr:hypothetical protein [Paenibacillus radicis (ex Gao et al. 2016)]GGG70743.1 hypothetical protein GCM10010918_27720 [Paenibacillus radicis (ex Gao et al. 2016)]